MYSSYIIIVIRRQKTEKKVFVYFSSGSLKRATVQHTINSCCSCRKLCAAKVGGDFSLELVIGYLLHRLWNDANVRVSLDVLLYEFCFGEKKQFLAPRKEERSYESNCLFDVDAVEANTNNRSDIMMLVLFSLVHLKSNWVQYTF